MKKVMWRSQPSPMATAWVECDRTGLGGRTVNHARSKPAVLGGYAAAKAAGTVLSR